MTSDRDQDEDLDNSSSKILALFCLPSHSKVEIGASIFKDSQVFLMSRQFCSQDQIESIVFKLKTVFQPETILISLRAQSSLSDAVFKEMPEILCPKQPLIKECISR